MEEAEENSREEFAPPEAETNTQSQSLPVRDHSEDWRAVRQQLKELKLANQEKDELLRQVLERQQSIPDEPELPDEEYPNHGTVKKATKKAIAPLEKELQELKSQVAYQKQQSMLSTFRQKYSDFDDVVNAETIALFEERKPELAAQIGEIKDPYRMTVQTYEFIKALNLAADVPTKRRQKEAEKMLDKNSKTMQSPQAYDKRPMAQAFRLSEADKSSLYDEMMQFGSMAGSVPELGM